MKIEVLKIAVAAMATTLLTGAAAWVVFGQDKVTRSELTEYVETAAPWVRDRGEMQSAIRSNTKNLERLERICDRAIAAQQQLIVEQRVLITKVDALLEDE